MRPNTNTKEPTRVPNKTKCILDVLDEIQREGMNKWRHPEGIESSPLKLYIYSQNMNTKEPPDPARTAIIFSPPRNPPSHSATKSTSIITSKDCQFPQRSVIQLQRFAESDKDYMEMIDLLLDP